MIVLGFDTATPATSVGLMLPDGQVLEGRDDPPAGARPGHSTRLLGLAHELLERAQLRWGQIERISVGLGPGTFTGLRIGVATARGLSRSLSVELVGVSSLQALAHPARDRDEGVLAVIDARRGEAFAAPYWAGERLAAARALPPERLGEALELEGASGDRSDWIAVGDGAVRFAETLLSLGVTVPSADSPLHAISGRSLCELGAHAPAVQADVVPDYGRVPDAEAALQGSGS